MQKPSLKIAICDPVQGGTPCRKGATQGAWKELEEDLEIKSLGADETWVNLVLSTVG